MKRSILVVATLLVASAVWACPFADKKDDKGKHRESSKAQILAAVSKDKTASSGKQGVR